MLLQCLDVAVCGPCRVWSKLVDFTAGVSTLCNVLVEVECRLFEVVVFVVTGLSNLVSDICMTAVGIFCKVWGVCCRCGSVLIMAFEY